MPKKIQKGFKTKKRYGLNAVNSIQKNKRKSKDTAVVFDENERHNFLTGIFNAKNKRKEFWEKRQKEQEHIDYRETNKLRRKKKKEAIDKCINLIGEIKKEDQFLQDYDKDKIITKVEELKNTKNESIIVKTSFLNI